MYRFSDSTVRSWGHFGSMVIYFKKRRTCFYCFQKAWVTVIAFYSGMFTDSDSVEEPLRISQSSNLNVNHRTSMPMRTEPASWYQTCVVSAGDLMLTWMNVGMLWSSYFKNCACSKLVECFSPGVGHLKPTRCSLLQTQTQHFLI